MTPDQRVSDGDERSRAAGERIAQYRLEGVISRGEQGVVYRATDTTLDRVVALKVITGDDRAARLIEEARNASRLSHPGIAAVYQAGRDDETGHVFVAFEWVEGVPLRTRLRRGALDLADFARCSLHIARAVAHAHEQGLVHGDLKADNVVETHGDGRLKLIDFGLSALVGDVQDGEIWGTPAYMAPELFAGAPRTVSSDLFALGVLLYELATGRLPYGGEDGDEERVREAQASGAPTPLRELRPELSAQVAATVDSLLSTDPGRRGPSAVEVARALRHLRSARRRRGRRRVLAVALLLLAGVGWLTRDRWTPAGWGAGGASPAASRPVRLVVAALATGAGEPSADARLGADLLTLFSHGDDPGSALIARDVAITGGAGETTGVGVAGVEVWQLTGSWRRSGGQLAVDLALARGTSWQELGEVRGASPLAVAREAARRALDGARAHGLEPDEPLATSLGESESALATFVAGVRASAAGELDVALERFRHAGRESPGFSEAAAWEIAVLVGRDQLDAASREVPRLRDRPGRLAAVIRSVLDFPVTDRRARWGAPHALAHRFDRTLDARDATTPDEAVRALAEDPAGELSSAIPLRLAELALLEGDGGRAADALARYRLSPGAVAWRVQLLEVRLRQQGGAGDPWGAVGDWLLGLPPGDPAEFLRISLQLARGRPRAALRIAESIAVDEPDGRCARVVALALGGQFDRARELARGLGRPLDRSLGERLGAAVEVLRGDVDAARAALGRALELDASHPRTSFLWELLDGRASARAAASAGGPPGPSRHARWRQRFIALARARRLRSEGDPAAALTALPEVAWVTPELAVVEWPELPLRIWLERIASRAAAGEVERAAEELREFRQWWPADRPAAARVSREATEVEQLVAGGGRGGQ